MEVTMKNGSSGMLSRVALVRTDVLEELSASFIRVTRIGELGTMLKNGVFPENTILHSYRRENLKSYIGTALAVTISSQHVSVVSYS
jgi:hypothetical protein